MQTKMMGENEISNKVIALQWERIGTSWALCKPLCSWWQRTKQNMTADMHARNH